MDEQNRTGYDWEELKTFLALARRGSLSAAARALGVNHATVARRIQSLEESVGDKLIERRPEGYVLTSAGTQALAAVGEMETAAQKLGRAGDRASPHGLVRVNAPPALAQGFLVAHLAELARLHPGLDIDLATEMRPVSLERHEADVAVRLGHPPDGDVLARRIATMGYGFYGTPSTCRRTENGEAPVLIGFDEANGHVPEATWLAREFSHARLAFRTDNQVAQGNAALTGVGVALLPHYIGRRLDGLELCRLQPVPPPRDVFLVTRSSSRRELAVRTAVDHLAAAFGREGALFADET